MKIIGTKVEIEGIIAAVNCTNASCECCLIGDYCKTHGTGEFKYADLERYADVEEVEEYGREDSSTVTEPTA